MPLIQVQNLSKSVPDSGRMLTILDDVSFDVQAGETVAIIGASGSGKSTLLGLLAGLDLPTGGDVQVDGQSLFAWDEEQRAHWRAEQVGFVFQSFQLLPAMTALENVMLPLELAAHPEAHRIARELLARVGLAERAGHYPRTLSGGEQQRVALARALAPNPRLLLLDEPLSALDRSLREGLARDIRSILRERGTSAIYVTHDQDEAMRVADVVGIMAGGRLLRLDTPEGLWADPGGVQVARFLGFGPFLDADAVAALELPLKLEYGQILAPAPGAWSLAPADASLGYGVAQAGVESVTMSQGSYLVQASLEATAADPLTLRTSEPLEVEQWINVRLDLSRCPLIDMRKRA